MGVSDLTETKAISRRAAGSGLAASPTTGAVVRAAGGRIVSYRGYWNLLALSDPAGAGQPS